MKELINITIKYYNERLTYDNTFILKNVLLIENNYD